MHVQSGGKITLTPDEEGTWIWIFAGSCFIGFAVISLDLDERQAVGIAIVPVPVPISISISISIPVAIVVLIIVTIRFVADLDDYRAGASDFAFVIGDFGVQFIFAHGHI